jgi:hypothetical protein
MADTENHRMSSLSGRARSAVSHIGQDDHLKQAAAAAKTVAGRAEDMSKAVSRKVAQEDAWEELRGDVELLTEIARAHHALIRVRLAGRGDGRGLELELIKGGRVIGACPVEDHWELVAQYLAGAPLGGPLAEAGSIRGSARTVARRLADHAIPEAVSAGVSLAAHLHPLGTVAGLGTRLIRSRIQAGRDQASAFHVSAMTCVPYTPRPTVSCLTCGLERLRGGEYDRGAYLEMLRCRPVRCDCQRPIATRRSRNSQQESGATASGHHQARHSQGRHRRVPRLLRGE